MHKSTDEIILALSRLTTTLDRNGVQVDTGVLTDIVNKIIYERIETQLEQSTTDWDLNSLIRLRNVLNSPKQNTEPELNTIKRPRAKKTVQ